MKFGIFLVILGIVLLAEQSMLNDLSGIYHFGALSVGLILIAIGGIKLIDDIRSR